jgi:hypothetical protein
VVAARHTTDDGGDIDLSGSSAVWTRRLGPWLGFLVVVHAVYGLESAVASASLSPSAALRIAPVAGVAAPRRVSSEWIRTTVILHDATTGRDLEWPCVSAPDNAPPPELVVDANGWAGVAAALCAG